MNRTDRHGPPLAPISAAQGVAWPAVPTAAAQAMLSTQFQLDLSQWWPADVLVANQFRQLRRLVAHASAHVPHYRDHFHLSGLKSPDALCPESFRQWPVLTKREIQTESARFLSSALPPSHGRTHWTATTGSTGQPLEVAASDVVVFFQHALVLRSQLWYQLDFSLKFATIKMATGEATLPTWGPPANAIYRTGPAVTQSVFADHRAQLEWLAREAPAYLLAHNTNLRALLELSRRTGLAPRGVKVVLGFTDMAAPDIAALARGLWNARYFDAYSCNEIGLLALQCPMADVLHVQSERVYVELLRDDGSACEPGEQGRVVVTDLHNFAMPLIRYDLGDVALLGAPCVCGRGLPVIERVLGRAGQLAVDPSGRTFYPHLSPDFWVSSAPILQRQIIQCAADALRVDYVGERDLNDDETRTLTAEIRQAMLYAYRITFNRVTKIAHAPGGKFEDFVPLGRQQRFT
jgi:phenylacetate-CoA ligase